MTLADYFAGCDVTDPIESSMTQLDIVTAVVAVMLCLGHVPYMAITISEYFGTLPITLIIGEVVDQVAPEGTVKRDFTIPAVQHEGL